MKRFNPIKELMSLLEDTHSDDELASARHDSESGRHYRKGELYNEMIEVAHWKGHPKLGNLYGHVAEYHEGAGGAHQRASFARTRSDYENKHEASETANKATTRANAREARVLNAIRSNGLLHHHEEIEREARRNLRDM